MSAGKHPFVYYLNLIDVRVVLTTPTIARGMVKERYLAGGGRERLMGSSAVDHDVL